MRQEILAESTLIEAVYIAILLATVLGGLGAYILLPHRRGRARPRTWLAAGYGLIALALGALASQWAAPPTILAVVFYYGFALLATGGALVMVTTRNPVYTALWFALVVLSTSGLFLLAGAQFLAAGTVIVYAGAIIVTFLFVLMLAQSHGDALYDRLARAPGRSAIVTFVLLGGLLYAITTLRPVQPREATQAFSSVPVMASTLPRTAELLDRARADARLDAPAAVIGRSFHDRSRLPIESSELATFGAPPPHVAGLGATLFSDHLINVELAGILLFIALIAAAAIATPRAPIRPSRTPRILPHGDGA